MRVLFASNCVVVYGLCFFVCVLCVRACACKKDVVWLCLICCVMMYGLALLFCLCLCVVG